MALLAPYHITVSEIWIIRWLALWAYLIFFHVYLVKIYQNTQLIMSGCQCRNNLKCRTDKIESPARHNSGCSISEIHIFLCVKPFREINLRISALCML